MVVKLENNQTRTIRFASFGGKQTERHKGCSGIPGEFDNNQSDVVFDRRTLLKLG